MRGFRHYRSSQDKVEALWLANPSSNARSEQKLVREVAKEKRNRLNSEKREKRVRERLSELKKKAKELEMVIEFASNESAIVQKQLDEVAGQNSELKEEVRHLTARFNSRIRQEPQKIEAAVQHVLPSTSTTLKTIHKVKTPDGIIQDWARNIILHLICESDVPAAKTWVAFSCVMTGLGIPVEGSWSPRSAGRVVLEGALAVEEMIVEEFLNNPCRLPVSSEHT